MRWLACTALLAALGATTAHAELDAADYKVEKVLPSGRAREQVRIEIERDIDEQARQALRDAEDQARRRAQAEAEDARRPYPQRLLQARCTLCHPADNYLNQRHTLLGWQLVIARMRWLNRAPLAWDEQFVIGGELARVRPATASDAAIEYGAGTAALALLSALIWGLGRWTRHRQG